MAALIEGIRWLRSPYRYLDRRLERNELTFRMELPGMGNCLVTGEPALVDEIAHNRSLIGGRGTQALRPVVGNHSLIVLDGREHEAHRAMLLPLFFTADPAQHDRLHLRWVDSVLTGLPRGATVSAIDLVAGITLNIIVEMIFGDLGATQHRIAVGLFQTWLASVRQPAMLFVKPLQKDLGAWSPWGRFLRNREAVHGFVRQQLARARTEPGAAIIDQMVQAAAAQEPAIHEDALVSEIVTFILFGHDTSAGAIGWAMHDLLRHPAVLQAVLDEVRSKPDPTDVAALTLTEAAIRESMRLHPVVVHLTRHAVAETQVGSYTVREGEKVLPCMYLAHRNPAIFERPAAFLPERFLTPQPAWRYAYFPFGLGTRVCAGMPLALRQMIIIFSRILAIADFELARPEDTAAVRKMVLIVPSGGPLLRRT